MTNDYTYEDIIKKDILDLMGASDMPEEKKKELYTKMLETIQNRVITKIFDQLTPENAEKLKQLIDKGNKSEIENFLKFQNIDLAKLMLEEALIYKTEMVDLSKKVIKEG